MSAPPDHFGPEFLGWFRDATETAWSSSHELTLADYARRGVGGSHWRRGTRWTGGLTAAEIETIEARFDVRFPPDHRLFLQTLHATTPAMGGARYFGDQLVWTNRSGAYDWRDEAAIRGARDNVVEGLAFDIEQNELWLETWGTRPPDAVGRLARLQELLASAPPLLPIFGHRYVLADEPTIVLSVHQSDIIVYGADLRAYLLNDFIGSSPDLSAPVDTRSIPFWGELIG